MIELSNENLKLIEQAGISLKGLKYKSSDPYKNGYIYIIENNDYEHDYFYEHDDTDFEYDCDSCGGEFSVEVNVEITYSTYVKD